MTDPGGASHRARGELDALAAALRAVTHEFGRAARAIPGVRAIEAQASSGERYLLRQIKRRLDEIESPIGPTATQTPPVKPGANQPAAAVGDGSPIDQRLRALLTRSVRDTPAESRRTLHEALLDELVPDEARILAAMSDGSTFPLVHIAEPGVGTYQKLVLENASSVGRAAGVALPDRVHIYVSHLRRLGLVESGPEDHALKDEYDVLLTEPKLRATIASIGKGPRGARMIRRTVRISDLGRELWEAANPPEDADADHPNVPPG